MALVPVLFSSALGGNTGAPGSVGCCVQFQIGLPAAVVHGHEELAELGKFRRGRCIAIYLDAVTLENRHTFSPWIQPHSPGSAPPP